MCLLEHVRVQLALHNHCELQRAEDQRAESRNEHIHK